MQANQEPYTSAMEQPFCKHEQHDELRQTESTRDFKRKLRLKSWTFGLYTLISCLASVPKLGLPTTAQLAGCSVPFILTKFRYSALGVYIVLHPVLHP